MEVCCKRNKKQILMKYVILEFYPLMLVKLFYYPIMQWISRIIPELLCVCYKMSKVLNELLPCLRAIVKRQGSFKFMNFPFQAFSRLSPESKSAGLDRGFAYNLIAYLFVLYKNQNDMKWC
jgi:hypothetical protein